MASEPLYDIEDVADILGITVSELIDRIQHSSFPAPSRCDPAGQPFWTRQQLTAAQAGDLPAAIHPSPTAFTKGRLALLDELRCHVMKRGTTADLNHTALGRPRTGWTRTEDDPAPWEPSHHQLGKQVIRLRADYHRGLVSEAEARAFDELPDWIWTRRGQAFQDQKIRRRAQNIATRWPHQLSESDKDWLIVIRSRWDEDDERALTRTQQNIVVDLLPGYLAMLPVAKFVDAANRWCRQHGQTIATMPQAAAVQLPAGRSYPVGKRAGYYRRRYLGKEANVPLTPEQIRYIETLPGWTWTLRTGKHRTRAV